MYHKSTWKVILTLLASVGLAIVVLFGASAAEAVLDGEVDLSIELKAPKHVEPGGTFVINLSYSNIGTIASPQDTWVKVSLPVGTSFVAAADQDGNDLPPDEIDGNNLTWLVGSIAPSTCCRHIMVTVQVEEDVVEETLLTVQGEVGSSAIESNLDNNSTSVTSIVCDMAGSTKQAQAHQFKPGDVVTYTITIAMTNRHEQGDTDQRDVSLLDALPPSSQVNFLGWVSETTGTYDGEHLHWQGFAHAGEPVVLQYRLGIKGEIPPGSLVTNRAHLAWKGGEIDIDPVDIETYLTENDHMFGPQGGQWQHQSGVTLEVPPDTVTETTRFEFRPLFEDKPPLDAPPGWIFTHRAFELTAFQFGELHRFNQPITITVGYDDKDVQGLDPQTLRLWFRTGPGEPWAMLGEPITHQHGQISFTTDHFTEFVLLGQGAYQIHLPILHR